MKTAASQYQGGVSCVRFDFCWKSEVETTSSLFTSQGLDPKLETPNINTMLLHKQFQP